MSVVGLMSISKYDCAYLFLTLHQKINLIIKLNYVHAVHNYIDIELKNSAAYYNFSLNTNCLNKLYSTKNVNLRHSDMRQ